jgi:DNA-binding GntR family transcriptional regulator
MQDVYNAPMAATGNERTASAQELAYEHLKSRIASIELRDALFLTEAEIATALGVSRTPVREAFLRLQGEGLLQLVPQKGAFVPAVSDTEIDDVMESRELIEVHCAWKLAHERSEIHVELEQLLVEQLEQIGDVEAFIACDRVFHERIVDTLGNALLTDFYRTLRDRQMRMGIRAVVHSPDRARQVISEHRAIVKALKDGDVYNVAEAVRSHLYKTHAILKGEQS